MTTNLIRHLRPHIRDCIDSLMSWPYTHEEIMVSLKKEKWYEAAPFNIEKFNFNGVMLTIKDYLNIRAWDDDSYNLAQELNEAFRIEAVGLAFESAKEEDKPAKGDLAA